MKSKVGQGGMNNLVWYFILIAIFIVLAFGVRYLYKHITSGI